MKNLVISTFPYSGLIKAHTDLIKDYVKPQAKQRCVVKDTFIPDPTIGEPNT